MSKRKTINEFKQNVFDLVNNEYIVLSDTYINNKTKISLLHIKCNNEYKVTPNDFLSGKRCPYCFGTHKKSIELIKQEIFNLVNNEYELLSTKYNNVQDKVKLKHNKCNNIYEVKLNNFLYNNNRCPYCNKSVKKDTNKFKQEIFNLVNNEYELINEYINCHTKVKLLHNKCNNIYEVTPTNFLRGDRCPYCQKLNKKNTDNFKQELFNLVGNEYTLLNDYINCHTKVKLLHNKCNNIYEIAPNYFLNGNRCPICNESKGEKSISNYLNNHNINYIKEYKFNDCKYKNKLRFDFYLNELNILIEYDGIQHYQSIKNFGGEEKFKELKIRDTIKNKYCKDNNIKLIRIKYTDYNNIDNILNEELSKRN